MQDLFLSFLRLAYYNSLQDEEETMGAAFLVSIILVAAARQEMLEK